MKDADNVHWHGPPPPPDPEIVLSDLSCQGTIAIALREALYDHQQEAIAKDTSKIGLKCDYDRDEDDWKRSEANDELHGSINSAIDLSPESVDRIILAFGQAVVQSHFEQFSNELKKRNRHDNGEAESQQSEPPAALLRGRINNYNRLSSKWRFVVDNVEIQPRKALDRNRRKRERPSFWQLCDQQPSASVMISQLEILVYSDNA